MRVKIVEVIAGRARPEAVVAAAAGALRGTWFGPAPVVGAERHVEIELGDVLVWGEDIQQEAPRPEGTETEGGATVIHGRLEGVQENGVVDVRFSGGLISVETEGDPPAAGSSVRLRIAALSLYDEQL